MYGFVCVVYKVCVLFPSISNQNSQLISFSMSLWFDAVVLSSKRYNMDSSHGRHGRQKQQRKVEKRSRSNRVLSRKRGAHGFGWRLRGLRDVGLGQRPKTCTLLPVIPGDPTFLGSKKCGKIPSCLNIFMFESLSGLSPFRSKPLHI